MDAGMPLRIRYDNRRHKIDLTYIPLFVPGMQRPAEKPVSLVFGNVVAAGRSYTTHNPLIYAT